MTHFAGKAVRFLVLTGLMTAFLAVSAMAAELSVGVGTITGSSVRMRAGASTSTSILTQMEKNTTVSVLGKANSNWYKISYDGKTGYVSADYLVQDEDNVFTTYGRTNGSGVNVRTKPNTNCSVVDTLSRDTAFTVTGLTNGWYSVTLRNGATGYIRSDLVALDNDAVVSAPADPAAPVAPSANGQAVVDLAKQFLGIKYVYGGSGPKTFDCSGYTRYIAKQFGISLAHSATSQWQSGKGTKVTKDQLEPGDFVFFCDPSRSNGKACSHCGIYIGNGQFIHASSSKGKVVISELFTSSYYNGYFVGGLRLF